MPRLWHLEAANVLLVGERRRQCSQADTKQWLSYFAGLPILVDVTSLLPGAYVLLNDIVSGRMPNRHGGAALKFPQVFYS